MRRAALALALSLLVVGCGDDEPRLTVSAASSLKGAFTEYGEAFDGAQVRLSFGGSDVLAAQIRAGARPDVFAAANEQLPARLFREGLVERPVRFAANRLVVAVRADGSRVRRLEDLARPGVKIATGSPSVPVGAYAQRVIEHLPGPVEANVRDREPDVSGVIAKVDRGAVDAAFVYATDVEGLGGRLRAIPIPERIAPEVAYAAAVVRGAPDEARRFVESLVQGEGRRALARAGFERP